MEFSLVYSVQYLKTIRDDLNTKHILINVLYMCNLNYSLNEILVYYIIF